MQEKIMFKVLIAVFRSTNNQGVGGESFKLIFRHYVFLVYISFWYFASSFPVYCSRARWEFLYLFLFYVVLALCTSILYFETKNVHTILIFDSLVNTDLKKGVFSKYALSFKDLYLSLSRSFFNNLSYPAKSALGLSTFQPLRICLI